jgi:hypothetical protein
LEPLTEPVLSGSALVQDWQAAGWQLLRVDETLPTSAATRRPDAGLSQPTDRPTSQSRSASSSRNRVSVLANDFESSDADASVPTWRAGEELVENAQRPLSHESLRDVVQTPDAAWDVPSLSVNADGEHMLPSTFDPTLLYSTLVLALR